MTSSPATKVPTDSYVLHMPYLLKGRENQLFARGCETSPGLLTSYSIFIDKTNETPYHSRGRERTRV